MSIVIRRVTLTPDANALLEELASQERIDPDIYSSLVLEIAVRERHDHVARFAQAVAKVLHGD